MELESFEFVQAVVTEAKAENSAIAHATVDINFLESFGRDSVAVLLKDVVEITENNIGYLSEGETINVPMEDVASLVINTAALDAVEIDV